MALLLPMPARTRPIVEVFEPATFAGAASASYHPPAGAQITRRAELKTSVRNRTYSHIVQARLSHIPRALPYGVNAIVSRLRESDQLSQGRDLQERSMELETDLNLLSQELERRTQQGKKHGRERRLSQIWGFLALHSERTQLLLDHRLGRLRHNVELWFRSDLPAVYLASSGESTHWEAAGLALAHNAQSQRLFQQITGRPAEEVSRDVFLATEVPLSKIDRAFREYQRRFAAMSDLADRILGWRDALEYYVDLFSASDLAAFRTPRQISLSSLDSGIIDELARGLQQATLDLRGALAAEYPGGLSEFHWMPRNDPQVAGLIQLELEAAEAG